MVGLGFYEVMSLMLTSEKQHYINMRLDDENSNGGSTHMSGSYHD